MFVVVFGVFSFCFWGLPAGGPGSSLEMLLQHGCVARPVRGLPRHSSKTNQTNTENTMDLENLKAVGQWDFSWQVLFCCFCCCVGLPAV